LVSHTKDHFAKLSLVTHELVQHVCQLWPPENWADVNVAIALSGGADSIALLRIAATLKQQYAGAGILSALHVNHHLRGTESEEDERWCAQQCETLKIPFQAFDGKVVERASQDRDGIEAAARQERYRLLTEAAEARGIRYLATAHTQDDQFETILFRFLRGTGLRGLAGMASARRLTPVVTLVRPLLQISRKQILDYLNQIGQEFRTDSSNHELQYSRNRIRYDLLPKLQSEYNSDVVGSVLRLSEQATEAQEYLEKQARETIVAQAEWSSPQNAIKSRVALPLSVLRSQEEVIVRGALRIIWREAGLAEQAMTYEWWHQLARLAHQDASTPSLNLPGNVRAWATEDWLEIAW